MKVLGFVFCGVFLLGTYNGYAQVATQYGNSSPYYFSSSSTQNEIQFLDEFKQCRRGLVDAGFCSTMVPKPWSEEEKNWVISTIEKFRNNGLAHFIDKVFQNGFHSFYRYQYGFKIGPMMANPLDRSQGVKAYVLDSNKSINFMDLFFNAPVEADPLSHFNNQELSLLHELVHAYDHDNAIASSKTFLKLAGFDEGGFDYQRAPMEQIIHVRMQTDRLKQEKKFEEAILIERKFGISNGMPRLYSMTNANEALADIAAFIYFDPHAREYISQDLYDFVKKMILE